MRRTTTFLLILLACGCSISRDVQFRGGTGEHLSAETSIEALRSPAEQRKVSEAAIERHKGFVLGMIEFSDEGLAWSRVQREAVLAMLREEARPHGAIIVTFVHGWKHNATVCDDNVACLRRVLAGLAAAESERYPEGQRRAIVGIYIGWRGLTYCREPMRTMSIWSRKRVGERLGESQGREIVREILRAYGDIKTNQNGENRGRTRLIVTGHSLGAGVVYSAFGPLIKQALTDAITNRNGSELEPIDKAGDVLLPDLVVLANPAFEAELYRRIDTDLRTMERLRLHFSPRQLPLMLAVSSVSDGATRKIFPPGQFFRYLFSPFEWTRGLPFLRRSLVSVANFNPYLTDRLDAASPAKPVSYKATAVTVKQRPPTSCFTGDWAATTGFGCDCAELGAGSAGVRAASRCRDEIDKEGHNVRVCGNVRITHIRPNLDTRNPFIVASAAREVINGHNDIYNPTFISFLLGFVSDVDESRARIEKTQNSD